MDDDDAFPTPQQEAFEVAADHVGSLIVSEPKRFSDQQKLRVYGLYKQCTAGDCTTQRPGFFDPSGRAKWDAWQALKGTGQQDAMQQYVQYVQQLDPSWDAAGSAGGSSGRRGGGAMGPVFSTLAGHEGPQAGGPEGGAADGADTLLHELAGLGDTAGLQGLLAEGADVNGRNADGATSLHFAADRGQVAAAELLLAAGAQLDAVDVDGQTALHYGALCGHQEVCSFLLRAGAAAAPNADGELPRDLAPAGWGIWQ